MVTSFTKAQCKDIQKVADIRQISFEQAASALCSESIKRIGNKIGGVKASNKVLHFRGRK